jgi:hypothetical protein
MTGLWRQLFALARILVELGRRSLGLLLYRRRPDPTVARVAFQAYSVHLAQFFAPVMRRLVERQPDVEVHLVVLRHPHFTSADARQLRQWATEELGLARQSVHEHALSLWRSWDVLVCADLFASFPLRRTRSCFLPHGPGLTSRALTWRLGRKTVWDFDLVLTSGPYDLELLQAAGRGTTEVVATGTPFLDRLVSPTTTAGAYLRTLGLNSHRPKVMFAPAWQTVAQQPDRGRAYVEGVVTALGELDVDVLVKLHSCLFNRHMSRGVDWQRLLEELCRRDSIAFDVAVDDRPALMAADVLVTDISSRSLNFMALEKPVVIFQPPFERPLTRIDRDRLQLIESGSPVVQSVTELVSAVESALAGEWDREAARSVAARALSNVGSATERVSDDILQQLRLVAGDRVDEMVSWRES